MRRLILAWLFAISALYAQTVATVGDRAITREDVRLEIENVDPRLPDSVRFETALENLIRINLLRLYADRQGVGVSEYELEEYVEEHLADTLPVLTYGAFDEEKYVALRDSLDYRAYFDDLISELRLHKAEELIRAGIDITDDEIQNQYIRDTYRLDLSYIVIDRDRIAIPDSLTPEMAEDTPIPGKGSVRLTFHPGKGDRELVFGPVPEAAWNNLLPRLLRNGRTVTALDPQPEVSGDEVRPSLASSAGERWLEFLRRQRMKHVSETAMREWYQAHRERYSTTAWVCRTALLDPARVTVRTNYTEKELKDWYKKHPDDYRLNGRPLAFDACHDRVLADLQANERRDNVTIIRARLVTDIADDAKLAELTRRYGVVTRTDTVFASRYPNRDDWGALIAARLPNARSGVVEMADQACAYRVIHDIPAYSPDFRSIRDEVALAMASEPGDDEGPVNYRTFYEEIRGDFTIPDSLTLGVVWFPADAEPTDVTESELEAAYTAGRNRFWMDEGYLCDAVWIADPGIRPQIDRLRESMTAPDLGVLAGYFGRPEGLEHRWPLPAEAIPEPIRTALRELPAHPSNPVQTLTRPLRYRNGWVIARRLKSYHDQYAPLADVRLQLESEIRHARGLESAAGKAEGFRNADRETASRSFNWVLLPRQDISEPFPLVGDLMPLRAELLKLGDGQPLNRVIRTADGAGVVVLISRNRVKPNGYAESLPYLKQAWKEKEDDHRARTYLNHLVARLRAGDKPEELLPWFGDWWSLTNLIPGDSLPGVPNSSRILADLRNRRAGEYLPPVKATRDQYLLLRVDRVQRGGRDDYNQSIDRIRGQILNHRYLRWMADYEREAGVTRL